MGDTDRTPERTTGHPARRVLLATAAGSWELDEDAGPLGAELDAAGIDWAPAIWTDPSARWVDSALVVVRSTWDYAVRRDEFVRWARMVEEVTTLANPAAVIEWNTDKHYLMDLSDAGVPVLDTVFVEPDLVQPDPVEPDLGEAARTRAGPGSRSVEALSAAIESLAGRGEFVVKPSVSAGSKDTGRFGPEEVGRATRLAEAIARSGRAVMLQSYVPSVDEVGETGLVYFGGAFSHGFTKGQMLERGADPTEGLYAPERITACAPVNGHFALAEHALGVVEQRFGACPLQARIDTVIGEHGDPVLMELELTEPAWFLHVDADSAARAAAAICSRLDG